MLRKWILVGALLFLCCADDSDEPPKLPDLYVVFSSPPADLTWPDFLEVPTEIYNGGEGPTGPISLYISVFDESESFRDGFGPYYILSISPGYARYAPFLETVWAFAVQSGYYWIEVTVDWYDLIEESEEYNNTAGFWLWVY